VTKDSGSTKGFSLPFARVALILAALVALAAVAVAVLRSGAGSPESGAEKAEATAVPEVETMIAGLEKKLQEAPQDARGWHLLGQAYYHVGRYPDAVKAYSRAVELDPKDAEAWSALGEVQVLTGSGKITPEMHKSFEMALKLDPKDFRARYFLAIEKNESGENKQALDELVAIVNESPADAPWLQPVRELAERISKQHGLPIDGRMKAAQAAPPPIAAAAAAPAMGAGGQIAAAGIPGPNSADLQAASRMTPTQQDEMARGMVARLAARLEENPRDADGWIRLMRARLVLKDPAGARQALTKAKAAFAGDSAQIARFDEAARTLGL
jgi:cytochrome c-type biogenesis protein CcmH